MVIFLWNLFARTVGFLTYVVFESILYYIFRSVIVDYIGGFIYLFDIAFVLWILIELVIRIVSGGTINLFKWIIGRFL
jgi:hypothetical protein